MKKKSPYREGPLQSGGRQTGHTDRPEYEGLTKRIGAAESRRVPAWLSKWIAGESAVNFLTASTRTSNVRFRRDFGWSPKFPGYREAFDEIVAAWRAENFLGLGRKAAA